MDMFPEQTDAPRRLSRRHFLRVVAGMGVAGAVGQLLAACGTAAPSTPAAPAATSGPVTVDQNKPTAGAQPAAAATGTAGGTFTFSRSSDSDNLDPVTQDGNVDIWIFMSIYDQLIRVSDDGLALQPMLAEKWEVSSDG